MRHCIFVLLSCSLLSNVAMASCYVTWNCGGSSQCAQLYGASSGRNGPFSSCSGFVQRDNAASCTCSSDGGSGFAAPVTGDPATAIGTSLGNALFDMLTAPSQPKSPEQIEQERQAAFARQQAEEERQQKIKAYEEAQARAKKEHDDKLDREAQDSLALLGTGAKTKTDLSDEQLLAQAPKKDEKKSDAYTTAYNHAAQCISRNAGATCSVGTAAQTTACVADYNAGYEAGAKKVQIEMNEAHDAGYSDGAKGVPDNGAADTRAAGGCRVQWIESYSRGHYAGKTKRSK